MNNIKWLILIAVSVLFLVSPCEGKWIESQKDTLVGVGQNGIYVVFAKQGFKEAGIAESTIRTDVERKLRVAGIRILSEQQSPLDYSSFLYVAINLVELKQAPSIVYNITVSFLREVILNDYAVAKFWRDVVAETADDLSSFCEDTKASKENLCNDKTTFRVMKRRFEEELTGCYASIWRNVYTGITPKSSMEETIRGAIKDLVDLFLNDYLSVNPIQPSTPKQGSKP